MDYCGHLPPRTGRVTVRNDLVSLTARLECDEVSDLGGAAVPRVLHGRAAVYGQGGAGDERALVAGEEHHGPRAAGSDPVAAASAGVRVPRIRLLAYLAAAGGAGAVGAVIALQTLYVEPTSVFSIQYSVYMLLMVLIGASARSRARRSARSPWP